MGVYFLDELNEEEFLKLNLRRVIPFSRFLRQLNTVPSLWFSNPEIWNDPYEARFLQTKYEIANNTEIDCPLKNRVFGCCFTTKSVSYEPDWLLYATNDKSIRIRYSNKQILKYLRQHAEQKSCDIYIGKVSYHSLTDIEKPDLLDVTPKTEILSQKNLVRLLFLKRSAYKFEEELRILIVYKVPQNNTEGISIDFSIEDRNALFRDLMLGPTFSLEEQKLWKMVLTELLNNPITYNEFLTNPVFINKEPSKKIKWTVLYHLQDKFKQTISAH